MDDIGGTTVGIMVALTAIITALATWQISIRRQKDAASLEERKHRNGVAQQDRKDSVDAYREVSDQLLSANDQLQQRILQLVDSNERSAESNERGQQQIVQLTAEIAALKEELVLVRAQLSKMVARDPEGAAEIKKETLS